jgi:hypothetical protein
METKFFPILFKIADNKSDKAQKRFININISILLLLVLSSLSSIYTTQIETPNSLVIFCTSCLIFSTLLNLFVLFFQPEKKWYEGRAIAESVKTLTWKFITGAKPFDLKLDDEKSQLIFNEILKKIIGQRKDFYILIGKKYPNENMISEEMISIRKSSFEERKKMYLEMRIQDQINWYSKKSTENDRYKLITFIVMICFQILGIIFFIRELNTKVVFSFTSISIALTSILLTWLQLKRFQELTESYAITAMELKFIKDKSKFILNDNDLDKYVDDSETAISREHTLWLARRDNIEVFN